MLALRTAPRSSLLAPRRHFLALLKGQPLSSHGLRWLAARIVQSRAFFLVEAVENLMCLVLQLAWHSCGSLTSIIPFAPRRSSSLLVNHPSIRRSCSRCFDPVRYIYRPYLSQTFHSTLTKTFRTPSTTDSTSNPIIVIPFHLSSLRQTLQFHEKSFAMDVTFDPFNFSATTLALIIAAIELYWARPRRAQQVSALMQSIPRLA